MATERTLSIIKPDAVAKHFIGKIYSCFEEASLRIIGAKMMQLSQAQAESFYEVHKERPLVFRESNSNDWLRMACQ